MAKKKNRNNKWPQGVDPEMLENLELLMNMNVIEHESDWDSIENMDEAESLEQEVSDEA